MPVGGGGQECIQNLKWRGESHIGVQTAFSFPHYIGDSIKDIWFIDALGTAAQQRIHSPFMFLISRLGERERNGGREGDEI